MSIPTDPDGSVPNRGIADGLRRDASGWWGGSDEDEGSSDTAGDDEDSSDDGVASSDDGEPWVDEQFPADRATSSARRAGRWTWAFGLAVVLVAAGLATTTPVLVAAGIVPLAAVAFAGLSGLPATSLSASRSFDLDPTAPGEPVEVELTITNEGDRPLPDVRLADGVPEATPVRSGSPRAALRLEPGESQTVTYTIGARRGVHEFGGVAVRVRNGPGTAVADRTLTADGDRRLQCELPLSDVPMAEQTTRRSGAVAADEHGEGLEFHSVRAYRRGDDVSDVDWRRYARTGELTTIRYRQERAATYLFAVDARDDAYVAPDVDEPSAARLSAFAASRAFDALRAGPHEAGLAVLYPGVTSFVEPDSDAATLARAREELEHVTARDPLGTTSTPRRARTRATARLQDLERRVSGRAQIVFLSPATDEFTERVARGLLAHGYPVTVLVPDVLSGDDPEQSVLAAERDRRLLDLRAAGARVVEWDRDEALSLVLERTLSRGERR